MWEFSLTQANGNEKRAHGALAHSVQLTLFFKKKNMKKLFIAIGLVAALSHCSNSADDKTNNKKEKRMNAGDREGADTSMIDLEDALSAKEKICQRWDNSEDEAEAIGAGGNIEMPFRGIYLFKDGSMVKNGKDDPRFGTWAFDEPQRSLQVKLANGPDENYSVQSLAFNKLVLKDPKSGKAIEYVADGFVNKDPVNDPFYPPNIQWEVKPKAAEDDAALKSRIKACLHFYYLYYMDNSKRNAARLFFYNLPTCFKWYAGGIHLIKEDELRKNWTDIFYNAIDASKAYIIVDKMISRKYIWSDKAHGWVRQNAGVLKQMEAAVDSL